MLSKRECNNRHLGLQEMSKTFFDGKEFDSHVCQKKPFPYQGNSLSLHIVFLSGREKTASGECLYSLIKHLQYTANSG